MQKMRAASFIVPRGAAVKSSLPGRRRIAGTSSTPVLSLLISWWMSTASGVASEVACRPRGCRRRVQSARSPPRQALRSPWRAYLWGLEWTCYGERVATVHCSVEPQGSGRKTLTLDYRPMVSLFASGYADKACRAGLAVFAGWPFARTPGGLWRNCISPLGHTDFPPGAPIGWAIGRKARLPSGEF